MDYRKDFYSRYVSTHTSHRYGGHSEVAKMFPMWRSCFGRFLPTGRDATVLDCGCGDGSFLLWLKDEGFSDLAGVDLSGEQVERARSLGITQVFETDVFEFLKAKEGEFDIIFARDLVEHMTKEEVLMFLGLAHTSLKPGGGLVIQTVNGESPMFGRLGHGDFTHETIFTRTSLSQVLRVAGFIGQIDVFGQEPAVHGLKSLVRLLLWRAIDASIRVYLLADTGSAQGVFSQNIIVCARK